MEVYQYTLTAYQSTYKNNLNEQSTIYEPWQDRKVFSTMFDEQLIPEGNLALRL